MEQYANSAQTTLNGTITSTATSLVVTSATGFPALAGQFRIVIDSEIMIVTGVTGTTFTVTRGAEGTTAVTHLNAATVTHIVTAASLQNHALQHGDITERGQGVLLSTGWIENLTNGSECRLHLFVSGDEGKTWNTIVPNYVYKDPADTNTYFAPANGQLRDCCFLKYKNKYYVAYTNNYGGTSNQFSIASATDLLNWSHLVDVSTVITSGSWVGAPEFFVDLDGTVYCFFQASTTSNQAQAKLYYVTATASDLSTWSSPTLVTGTNFPSYQIDPCVIKIGNTYWLFYKNTTTNQVEVASSTSPTSGYTVQNSSVTPNTGNYEAPTIVQLDSTTWRLFVDHRTDQGINYLDSSDGAFATWTSPAPVNAPYKWQHGTVVRVRDVGTQRHIDSAFMTHAKSLGTLAATVSSQTLSDSTWTELSFSSMTKDELGAWQSGTPTRFTAPSSGYYTFSGHTAWQSNTSGQRLLRFYLNGTVTIAIEGNAPQAPDPGFDQFLTVTTWMDIGDYVELSAYQTAGGTLTAQSFWVQMVRLGGG